MRALSIKQPWLYAIMHLGKQVENRDWRPPDWIIGERIALHASARPDTLTAIASCQKIAGVMLPKNIPMGRILATAVIVGFVGIDGSGVTNEERRSEVLDDKWFFGDYGWMLDDVRILETPVPYKGALGLWRCPDINAAALGVAA
ncbi:MAG: hypothetical protein IPL78_36375 [Chloroflexi bacterium]|nr:hypothetical protein [Chloroflexota bacterium]